MICLPAEKPYLHEPAFHSEVARCCSSFLARVGTVKHSRIPSDRQWPWPSHSSRLASLPRLPAAMTRGHDAGRGYGHRFPDQRRLLRVGLGWCGHDELPSPGVGARVAGEGFVRGYACDAPCLQRGRQLSRLTGGLSQKPAQHQVAVSDRGKVDRHTPRLQIEHQRRPFRVLRPDAHR
jgi:hypothetical protein